MAKEAWPTEEVIDASEKIVCLAVYRWGESRGEGATRATDWAIRFNVMGYPQFRFLDGWARPLAVSNSVPRTKTGIRDAMIAAAQAVKSEVEPPRIRIPAPLKKRIPQELREAAFDPDCTVRAHAWSTCLESMEFDPNELLDLYKAESDPMVRLAVLDRIDADSMNADIRALLKLAVEGDNDYVREKALITLGKAKGSFAADIVSEVIERVLEGKSGWDNPNNMLCTAARVSGDIQEKSLIPALERILETQSSRNYATRLARDALAAIKERSPRPSDSK